MAALFGHGNPLATPVGQLIERATDGAQATENWALFMEVCDLINETDEGPKDACKAFKKRLSQNVGKNFTAVIYTLTCLETCVKNCGRRFHQHVATKDFLQDLVKVIGPKHDPPQSVQEKVLQMIQTWADAFRGVPDLKEVEKTYQELKSKGIEFPMTDLDNMAPIHTPARSVPYRPPERIATDPAQTQQPMQGGLPVRGGAPTNPPPPIPSMMPAAGTSQGMGMGASGYPVSLTPEQRSKLTRELDVVQGNCRVMNEMLTELSPSSVEIGDWELLQELNRTCRQMRQRILELLVEVANEDVTYELLRVNDDLNNIFLRYERFERYVSGQTVPEASEPSPASDHLPPSYDQFCSVDQCGEMECGSNFHLKLPAQTNPNVGNLIDLDEPAVSSRVAGLNLSNNLPAPVPVSSAADGTTGDEEFDMFAQSRQSFDQNRQATGPIYSNQKEDQMAGGLSQAVNIKSQTDQDVLNLQDQETDYNEMEQWLATHDPNAASESGARPEGLTSSEFDRFLIERASAAESVPTIPAQTGQQPTTRNTRQLKKDEEDNSMFAL